MALNIRSVERVDTSTNAYAQALLDRPTVEGEVWRWDTDATAGGDVHWHLANAGWTAAQFAAMQVSTFNALAAWSNVANLNFVNVNNANQAEILVRSAVTGDINGFGGWSGGPEEANVGFATGQVGVTWADGVLTARTGQVLTYLATDGAEGDPWALVDTFNANGSISANGFQLILHELGHALGLEHTHSQPGGFPGLDGKNAVGADFDFSRNGVLNFGDDRDFGDLVYDPADNNLNTTLNSVMSYNHTFAVATPMGANANFDGTAAAGPVSGPMALDIAAIQELYGANTRFRGGNDSYRLPEPGSGPTWSSLWDTGGTDEIIYDGTANAVIDLRAATLDNSPTGGGLPSYTWRIDATGATVFGRFGTIAGDVTGVLADQGTETGVVIENARGGSGHDHIIGNGADNILRGFAGNDFIDGGDGYDVLDGGAGVNTIVGGGGKDTIEVSRHAFNVVMGGDDIDTLSFAQAGAGVTIDLAAGLAKFKAGTKTVGSVAYGEIENLTGSAYADTLIGDGKNNRLAGGLHNDRLDGRGGSDRLHGGSGDDTFVFANGWGRDRITDFAVDKDRLDMTGVSGLTEFSQLVIKDTASGASVAYGADTVTFDGVAASQITAKSFLFGAPLLSGRTFEGTTIWGGTANGTSGPDVLSFANAKHAVFVDLARDGGYAEALDGTGRSASLLSIENVRGAPNALNYLSGDARDNVLTGGALTDRFAGRGGSNTLDGKGGVDFADYYELGAGVRIDLVAGRAVHSTGTDSLISVEQFRGTYFSDTFAGDLGDNYFLGMNGDDTVRGNGGADRLEGAEGADVIDGGAGNDLIFGGQGADRLTGGADQDTFVFRRGEAGGDVVVDFSGLGAAVGDQLRFEGYGPAASFTRIDATHWAVSDGTTTEVITFTNAAAIHTTDYLFV